jgi:hypothetical protein
MHLQQTKPPAEEKKAFDKIHSDFKKTEIRKKRIKELKDKIDLKFS